MRIERAARKRRPISLTPLIDVVFLLLVFFMLASTFQRYTGIDLSGGRSSAAARNDLNNLVLVRVKGGDNVEINGREVALSALADEVRSMVKDDDLKVAIKPIEDADVQQVVNVIEAIRIDAVKEIMVLK